jgi:hypothetical protein
MAQPVRNRAKVLDLLAGEAAGDLSLEESLELAALRRPDPLAGSEQLMTAAGLAQLSFLKADRRGVERMPENLQARLLHSAKAWSASRAGNSQVTDIAVARRERHVAATPSAPQRQPVAMAGWAVAAALAVAFVVFRASDPGAPGRISAEQQRAHLMSSATDLLHAPWSPPSAPGYEGVRGDVLWSSARQEGYLRLAGLPENDPARNQYQLWIVDPERDANPVDGGVFDVPSSGEVTIPIQAKLAIGRPRAFAITLEQPGGVVVSKGPLLVVAAVGS